MLNIALQNVSDCKVTVTSTATGVYSLMNTASTVTNSAKYYDDAGAGALSIMSEDGDIRWLEGNDPTATEGNLIKQGQKEWLPGVSPVDVRLIRVGGSDVAVTILPYKGETGDSPALMAGEIFLETGDLQIGAVEIKDADSAVRLDVELDSSKNAAYVQSESLASAANQLPDGHNVTIDNAAGAAAVNVQDGGNSLTVDATDLDIRDLTSASDDVSVTTVKPDGTNTMPSLDTVARAGFQKITDGVETANVTAQNELNVMPSDCSLEIAKGNISGTTFVHKFGEAPDFDTGDGFVTIWDGADDGNTNAMVYTYSSTADIGLMSSSNAGDGQTVEIQGLLSDDTLSVQSFTLNGQTDVDLSATGSDFKRVFRLKNTGATDLAGDVYLRTNGSAQTGGVPNTANTVRLKCRAGQNQTLMSIYTIPTGKTGYMDSFYASSGGANRSANYDVHLVARPSGGVFQLKNSQEISDDAVSRWQHFYKVPEKFVAGTDIEIRARIDTGAITAATISAGFDLTLVDD